MWTPLQDHQTNGCCAHCCYPAPRREVQIIQHASRNKFKTVWLERNVWRFCTQVEKLKVKLCPEIAFQTLSCYHWNLPSNPSLTSDPLARGLLRVVNLLTGISVSSSSSRNSCSSWLQRSTWADRIDMIVHQQGASLQMLSGALTTHTKTQQTLFLNYLWERGVS